jgi:hypothetical protein
VEKLREDEGFASRFYRAIAILCPPTAGYSQIFGLCQRSTLQDDNTSSDDLSPEMLDNVPLAKARFDWLLRRLRNTDYAALPNKTSAILRIFRVVDESHFHYTMSALVNQNGNSSQKKAKCGHDHQT